jgi:hypothetical protein
MLFTGTVHKLRTARFVVAPVQFAEASLTGCRTSNMHREKRRHGRYRRQCDNTLALLLTLHALPPQNGILS